MEKMCIVMMSTVLLAGVHGVSARLEHPEKMFTAEKTAVLIEVPKGVDNCKTRVGADKELIFSCTFGDDTYEISENEARACKRYDMARPKFLGVDQPFVQALPLYPSPNKKDGVGVFGCW